MWWLRKFLNKPQIKIGSHAEALVRGKRSWTVYWLDGTTFKKDSFSRRRKHSAKAAKRRRKRDKRLHDIINK